MHAFACRAQVVLHHEQLYEQQRDSTAVLYAAGSPGMLCIILLMLQYSSEICRSVTRDRGCILQSGFWPLFIRLAKWHRRTSTI